MVVVLALGAMAGCGSVGTQPQRDDAGTPDAPGVDAAVDAPIDAAPKMAEFDIVYVNEVTRPSNITNFSGFMVIVNRGSRPFALSKVTIKDVRDDNANLVWRFDQRDPPLDPDQQVQPGNAAGALSQQASQLLYTSGLLPTTQVFDDELMDHRWFIESNPPVGTDFTARVTIQIDDSEVELPFTIHIRDVPGSQLQNVRKVSSR